MKVRGLTFILLLANYFSCKIYESAFELYFNKGIKSIVCIFND